MFYKVIKISIIFNKNSYEKENLYFVFISIDYEFLVVNILYDKKVMEECFIYWWCEDVIDLS